MKEAVREAAIEFCARSKLVTESLDFDTVVDQEAYPLAPAGGLFSEVQKVVDSDDGQLNQLTIPEYDEKADDSNDPIDYVYVGNALKLWPTPSAIETHTATGIIRPADTGDTATTIPDELFTNWRQAIGHGAKYIIHSQYDDYLDPKKASFNYDQFEIGIFRAGVKRSKGGSSMPLRSRSRFQ